MRHAKIKYQLNRFTSWRKATVISLASSLIRHKRITTTLARAKAARPLAEKLVSLAKENTLTAKRMAYKILSNHQLVVRLFSEIGPSFKERKGGYTRVILLGNRRGDCARMCLLELTEFKKEVRKPKKIKEGKLKEAVVEEPETQEAGPEIMPGEKKPQAKEKPAGEEKKAKAEVAVKEKPPVTKKPAKKFLGGIRNIFKKERDSL